MQLSQSQLDFIKSNRSAAMITTGGDGVPKAVRVGVALVDGKIWSSGTADRVRTRRLRQDPRCTLFVFSTGHDALTLETTVEILDGPEAPDQSIKLFRVMQKKPDGPLMWFGQYLDERTFRQAMINQRRLIYEFHVEHAYGVT